MVIKWNSGIWLKNGIMEYGYKIELWNMVIME